MAVNVYDYNYITGRFYNSNIGTKYKQFGSTYASNYSWSVAFESIKISGPGVLASNTDGTDGWEIKVDSEGRLQLYWGAGSGYRNTYTISTDYFKIWTDTFYSIKFECTASSTQPTIKATVGSTSYTFNVQGREVYNYNRSLAVGSSVTTIRGTVTIKGYAYGTNTVSTATFNLDNMSQGATSVIVDGNTYNCPAVQHYQDTAPTVSIELYDRGETWLQITAIANASCTKWEYSVDGGATYPYSTNTASDYDIYKITGLNKGTAYRVKVRATKSGSGLTGVSPTVTYTTLDLTPPVVSASISSVTANSCALAASANVPCNKWEYSLNGGSSWTTFSTTSGTSASTTISGLSPATTYTITVRATRSSNSVTGTTTVSASTLGFSTIASIGATNTGSKNTLTFLSYSGSFYFQIQYKLGNSVLATENIGTVAAGTTKSYTSTYAFPHSLLPNSTSAKITATLYTYSNSGYTSQVGSDSKTFTLTVPSSVKPTISSVTLSPYNTNSWINSKGYWVAGFTRADVTTSATAGSGASISSIVATGDITGTGASFRSGVLSSGTKSVTITVTDSRGRTATRTVTQVVQAYNSPTATIVSAQRGTYANGTWTADEDGNHIRVQVTGVVSLSGNVCTLHCIIGSNAEQTTTGTSGTWYATNTDNEHVYQIQVWASDSVGSVGSRSIVTVSSSEVPFSWNADRIGFGMVAQSARAVDIAQTWMLRAFGKQNQMSYMPYSWACAAQDSSSGGYIRVCTIVVSMNNVRGPIIFDIQRRSEDVPHRIIVSFAQESNTDPAMGEIYYDGATSINAFIYKTATSTWDLYVGKNTAYERLTASMHLNAWMQNGITVTHTDAYLSSVPSGAVMAKGDPALYWDTGDTYSCRYLVLNGIITSSTKGLRFTWRSPKRLDNVTTVTVSAMTGTMRGVQGYFNSDSSIIDWTTATTITALIRNSWEVGLELDSSTAFTNVPNNTPVSFYANTLFKLTFT